jgi:hypothetical protein
MTNDLMRRIAERECVLHFYKGSQGQEGFFTRRREDAEEN